MGLIQQRETWSATRKKINQTNRITYAEFIANTDFTYTAGSVGSVTAGDIFRLADGSSWEVAASGASDQHLTVNGVKWYEAGPNFSTRAIMVAAKARMDAAGDTVSVGTIWTDDLGRYRFLDDANTDITGMIGWAKSVPGTISEATKQATTSGTAFDFTAIPAGTKEVIVCLNKVNLSAADDLLVQIGPSGGLVTTGYASSSSRTGGATTSTVGFHMNINSFSPRDIIAVMRLYLMDEATNTWLSEHNGFNGPDYELNGSGMLALSGELTQLRLTRSGTDTFNQGEVNILYR